MDASLVLRYADPAVKGGRCWAVGARGLDLFAATILSNYGQMDGRN